MTFAYHPHRQSYRLSSYSNLAGARFDGAQEIVLANLPDIPSGKCPTIFFF